MSIYKNCKGCFLEDQYCFIKTRHRADFKSCPCSICLVKITCRDKGKYECVIRGKYIWSITNKNFDHKSMTKEEVYNAIWKTLSLLVKEESTNLTQRLSKELK